jgi:glycosyltransferase involved in cell wall biosynthesis
MAKRVWITWEKQRRNRTLSTALDCRLFEFNLPYGRIWRYPMALSLTVATLVKERPTMLFVQNPSIVLAAFAVAYGWLVGLRVGVDTHNAGATPRNHQGLLERVVAGFIRRRAYLTIVSNQLLADLLRPDVKGKVAVVPDPMPCLQRGIAHRALRGRHNVLFVCSWANDEPYVEVIKAAALLDEDTYIYVTGKSRGKDKTFGGMVPPNVVFTGYLPDEDYVAMLFACDVVVDLTTREGCLVCGGYEAVAAERPVILSDTVALRSYFARGALFTNNTYPDIAERIHDAIARSEDLVAEVRALKQDLIRRWEEERQGVEGLIEQAETGRFNIPESE